MSNLSDIINQNGILLGNSLQSEVVDVPAPETPVTEAVKASVAPKTSKETLKESLMHFVFVGLCVFGGIMLLGELTGKTAILEEKVKSVL